MLPRLAPLAYLRGLSRGRTVLWCYLLWYLVTVANHFDATPAIWLNSLGISAVIGVALRLSVAGGVGAPPPGRWQTFRLFMMPFGVSSFSSLIKGHGYLLIVPPTLIEQLEAVGACVAFVLLVVAIKSIPVEEPCHES